MNNQIKNRKHRSFVKGGDDQRLALGTLAEFRNLPDENDLDNTSAFTNAVARAVP
jgi:hypothetical protein